MGKIFGISDLPVSTIMTPFEPVKVPLPPLEPISKFGYESHECDRFITEFSRPNSSVANRFKDLVRKMLK